MERELKLVLDAPGYLRLASSLPGYSGEHWLVNHYFDTSRRELLARGAMFRIRETQDRRGVALKRGIAVRDGAFEAAEWEEPLADRDWVRVVRAGGDLGILDRPIVDEGFALAGSIVLPYLGSVRVLRRAHRIASGAAIELDLVSFADGTQDWELEVEAERLDGIRPLVCDLLAGRGIARREQTRTKFERFLDHPVLEAPELCEAREGDVVLVDEGLVVKRAPLRGDAVFATRAFAPGDRVFELEGALLEWSGGEARPPGGRRWVQVGERSFLDVTGTVARFINHSCVPNVGIRGSRTAVAMRPIAPGDEVTYDFAMTELRLELVCCCGTRACRGLVGGYARLAEGRRRL